MQRISLVGIGCLALSLGCASGGVNTSTGSAGTDPLVIRAEEIHPESQPYVINVVKQVRPNWLTMNSNLGSGIKRATGYAIYEDGVRVGGLDMLNIIPSGQVASIRFIDSNRALSLPGMGSDVVLGAIMLTMRR